MAGEGESEISDMLGLAAICAPFPLGGGQAASLDRVRSGCLAGERAPLRRAWRGVGCSVRGREGEVGELEGGEGGGLGRVHPLVAAAQKRAEVGRLHLLDLPGFRSEER